MRECTNLPPHPLTYIASLYSKKAWTQTKEASSMDSPTDPRVQWKPSAIEALLLFLFMVAAFVGLCGSAALKRKRNPTEQDANIVQRSISEQQQQHQHAFRLEVVKKILISSFHRKEDTKQQVESASDKAPQKASEAKDQGPLLPLWQRRILMGERCQLPRFSGLILYDERGRPLHNSSNKDVSHEAKPAAVVTALKELL